MSLRVAIVCPQAELRMTAAKAFDSAPAEWELTLVSEPPAEADVVVAVGTAVPGAVVMDLADPAAVVEEIVCASVAGVIAVVGASGGCGTTSLSLHLAAALSRSKRVNLVDLQPDGGAALRLGLILDDVADDADPMLLPVAGGFRLAIDRSGSHTTEGCLAAATANADSVIVDAPAALLPSIPSPRRVVLVMTPSVPSATRAARLMERYPALPWAPVTNRIGPGSETARIDIERVLGRRLALDLPCSPGLRDAEDDLRLLDSPLSPWLMRVRRLAAAL